MGENWRRWDEKSAGATAPSWGRGNFQQKIICDRISPSPQIENPLEMA
jgi:hypothetical protein